MEFKYLKDLTDPNRFKYVKIKSMLNSQLVKVEYQLLISDDSPDTFLQELQLDIAGVNNELDAAYYDPSNYALFLRGCVEGKIINAIKAVRTMSGYGLKEAKDYVDDIRSTDMPGLEQEYLDLKKHHPELFV